MSSRKAGTDSSASARHLAARAEGRSWRPPEIDLATAPGLRDALREIIDDDDRVPQVPVDLSGVEFCEAIGLRVLAAPASTSSGATASGVCAAEGRLLRVLRNSGLTRCSDVPPHGTRR
ncbi:STAS domain-containing protein [Spirillospora sp. CA-255316]